MLLSHLTGSVDQIIKKCLKSHFNQYIGSYMYLYLNVLFIEFPYQQYSGVNYINNHLLSLTYIYGQNSDYSTVQSADYIVPDIFTNLIVTVKY